MAPDDPSGARPAPVVLRIKLRYDDVETLAARFAPNVGKSGLFLPTKTLQAVGAEVKFELRLADDKVVITGLGKVKAVKAMDPDQPRAAFGMAIELTRVTRESRDVMLKILAKRKELGLPEVAIPMPSDIDAAKQVDTGVRDISAAVPTPIPTTIESAPIAATTIDSSPKHDSGRMPRVDASGPETAPVLTAPRRASGPIAIAKVHTVSALAPEAPRRKRPAMSEIMERASGPIASVSVNVPGLDDDVDVAAVMAMARALAGSDLDAELEALRDSAAAPIEISIEAASAELARQLGGVAVRRGWAPPPPIEESKPVVVEEPKPEPEPVVEAKAEPEPEPTPEPTPEPPSIDTDPVAAIEPAAPEPEPEEPVAEPEFVAAQTFVEPAADGFSLPEEDHEVDPEQIADEIHQLGEDDFEEVEHTAIGSAPEPEPTPVYTEPSVAAAIEASLDQQLAEADEEPDDLGFSPPSPIQHYAAPDSYPPPETYAPSEAFAAPENLDEEELEEIDDFEILAEADEEDADLLASHGEEDASGSGEVYRDPAEQQQQLQQRPSYDYSRHSDPDFAARLELSDEHHAAPDDGAPLDPHKVSAGYALAAFDDRASYQPETAYEPMSELAQSEPLPADDFDSPHADFHRPSAYARAAPAVEYSPAHQFDDSDVHDGPPQPEPRYLRPKAQPQPQPQPRKGDDGYDLETALEALDVDLDDLSIPHAKTERGPTIPPTNRPRSGSQRLPSQRASTGRVQTRIPQRPTTDDGVLIDFDDDDE